MKRLITCLLAFAAALLLPGCDQYIARNFGGNVILQIPPGEQLVGATWKESNLWILTYEQRTGNCFFRENSASGVLQGSVTLKGCNPIALTQDLQRSSSPVFALER